MSFLSLQIRKKRKRFAVMANLLCVDDQASLADRHGCVYSIIVTCQRMRHHQQWQTQTLMEITTRLDWFIYTSVVIKITKYSGGGGISFICQNFVMTSKREKSENNLPEKLDWRKTDEAQMMAKRYVMRSDGRPVIFQTRLYELLLKTCDF